MLWEDNKYGGKDLKAVNPLLPEQKLTVYSIGKEKDGTWAIAGEFDCFFCFGLKSEEEARRVAEDRFANTNHMEIFEDCAHLYG